jgi:hypothetical protein
MTNDTKDLLMQYLFRIAEHYGIDTSAGLSFRRRAEMLEQLRSKDETAAKVIGALIDSFIKEDRITNDKEKFDRARPLWESEHADAEKEKVEAEMLLIRFCKENSIPVGKIAAGA